MKGFLSILSLLGTCCCFDCRASELEDVLKREGVNFYLFQGVTVQAKWKSQMHPVVGAEKKGLLIDSPKGVKRIRYSTPSNLIQKVCLSTNFVEILDRKAAYVFKRKAQMEASSLSQGSAMQGASETQIGLLSEDAVFGRSVSESNMEKIQEIESLQEEYEENMLDSLIEGSAEEETVSDYVALKLSLKPERTLEDVFCALVFFPEITSKGKGETPRKVTVISLERVGTLQGGVLNEVKLGVSVREGVYPRNEYELFLFSGDGETLATNISKSLKKLSVEEIAALRAAQK